MDSAYATTHTVTSSADTHDANPGDGICLDADGFCTLRAAVEEANLSTHDTVMIAVGSNPIFLHLGAIVITGANTSIAGIESTASIDGRFNRGPTLLNSRTGAIYGTARLRIHAAWGADTTRAMIGNQEQKRFCRQWSGDSTSAAISIERVAQSGISVRRSG